MNHLGALSALRNQLRFLDRGKALAIEAGSTHACTMAVLCRLGGAHGGDRHVAILAAGAAKLTIAFARQVEVMRRLNHGGNQTVQVEHVHVYEGGSAAVRLVR